MRTSIIALGMLLWGANGRIVLDDQDAIWAARMVIGSQTAGARQAGCTGTSAAAAARLWTAANRHALLSSRGHRFTHFRDSFRAYSTAIAPQWSRAGWCAPGARAFGTIMCSEQRLRRRAAMSSMSWSSIATRYCDLRGYIERFFDGEIPVPPGIEVAAHTDCVGCSRAPRGAVLIGSNWWAPDGDPAELLRLHVRFQRGL